MEPSTENQHRKKGTYGFTHMKPSDGNHDDFHELIASPSY